MESSSDNRHPVEVLAEEFQARKKRGEKPTLEEYVARHPELADEIRDLFPAILMMEDLGGASVAGSAADAPAPSSIPKQIGDYRILREVGRGGMGVVYEAEQESLGRRVALKVLPAHALMDNKQIRRFEREAKAAARLHHTNIVPVFGVGHEVGAHYYVMQFIQGLGLEAVLEELQRLKVKKHIHSSAAGKTRSQGYAAERPADPDATILRKPVPAPATPVPPAADKTHLLAGAPQDVRGEGVRGEGVRGEDSRTEFQAPAEARPSGSSGGAMDLSAVNIAQSLMTGVFAAAPDEGEQTTDVTIGSREGTPESGEAPTGLRSTGLRADPRQAEDSVVSATRTGPNPSGNLSGDRSDLSGLSESGQRYWQSVARIGLQVAQALDYAHGQGVLHRDIKPSNLLLDLKGTVWVTDFGLAKSNDAEDLTHTGDIVGTVRYMAPERFRGESDARSDVYALGLTIYEMLALKPAFEEKDRAKLMKEVMHGEPARLRRVNGSVPRDLETIVHKAIAHDREHRYKNAAAMADDLKRYLEDRPIQARQVSVRERFWRWCRRNPALAASTGLAVAGLLAVAVVSVFFAAQQAHSFQELRFEQAKTKEALDKAETLAAKLNKTVQELRRHSGRDAVEIGQRLVEQGQTPEALLWMTRGLELADKEDVRAGIRLRLGSLAGVTPVLRQVFKHGSETPIVAASPAGKTIATAGNDGGSNRVWLWDAATGQRHPQPLVFKDRIHCLAFSPDGRILLTGGDDRKVRAWQVETGQSLPWEVEHCGPVTCLAFSPDGKTAVSGGSDDVVGKGAGEAMHFEVPTGKILHAVSLEEPITAVAFDPSGKRFATASLDKNVWLWDTAPGDRRDGPLKHPSEVVGLAFGPDGRLITACKDGQARAWIVDGQVAALPGFDHKAPLSAVAVSPDGQFVATVGQGTVRLWNGVPDQAGRLAGPTPDVSFTAAANAAGVVFHAEGREILIPGADGVCRLWEIPEGPQLRVPLRTSAQWFITDIMLNPEKNEIGILTQSQRAELRSLATNNLVAAPLTMNNRFGPVGKGNLPAFGPVGKGNVPTKFGYDGVNLGIYGMSNDGQKVVTSTVVLGAPNNAKSTRQLWDLHTRKEIGRFEGDLPPITRVLFSPDDKLMLIGTMYHYADQKYHAPQLQIWDSATLRPAGPVLDEGHEFQVFGGFGASLPAAWSPDGSRLVVAGSDNMVRLYDVKTHKLLDKRQIHNDVVAALAFSPNGKILATASHDSTVRLWDAATGAPIGRELQHHGRLQSVAFSPDGSLLATGCADKTARLWDVNTGQLVGQPLVHPLAVTSVVFSGDGKTLLTGGQDGQVRFWRTPRPVQGEAETLVAWAERTTGMGIGAEGTVQNLDAETWHAHAAGLQERAHPYLPSRRTAEDWRLHQLEQCVAAGNFAGALWHIDRQLPAQPKNPRLHMLRVRALVQRGFQPGGSADMAQAAQSLSTALRLDPAAAEAFLSYAAEAANLGQWPTAFWHLDEMISAGLKSAPVLVQRADYHERWQRWQQAADDYEQAAKLSPEPAELWRRRGQALARLGKWDDVAASYLTAAELYKKAGADQGSVDNYNQVLRDLANWDGGFEKAAAREPKMADLWRARASTLADHGKFAEAVAALDRAVEIEPALKDAYVELGNLLSRAGRWQEAAASFRKAVEQNDGDRHSWIRLAALHLHQGEMDAYRAVCQDILKRFGDTTAPDQALEIAELCLLPEGGVTDDTAQALLERAGRLPRANLTKGVLHFRAGRFPEALKSLFAYAPRDKHEMTIQNAHAALAHLYVNNAAAYNAAAQQAAQQFSPTFSGRDPEWLAWVFASRACKDAEALGLSVSPRSNIASFKDELKLSDPKDRVRTDCVAKIHELPLLAGRTYQIDMIGFRTGTFFDPYLRIEDSAGKMVAEDDDSGGNQNARIHFTPAKADTYRLVATTCNKDQQGQYRLEVREGVEDKVLFAKALKRWPNNVPLLITRGEQLGSRQQWREAAALFTRVTELKPDEHWYWYQTAALRLELRDYDEYARLSREMLKRFGDDKAPEVAERTGKNWLMAPNVLSDIKPGVDLIRRANANPKHGFGFWFTFADGLADYRQGDYRQALDRLAAFEKSGNANQLVLGAMVNTLRGMALQKLGQAEEARQAQVKAEQLILQQYPQARSGGQIGAWADYLRYLAFDREMNAQWEETYAQAFKVPPDKAALWAQRAEWHAAAGRWDKALADSLRAVELSPDDPGLWYRRAMAELALDKLDDYRATAKDMVPRFKGSKMAEKALRLGFTWVYVPDAVDNADELVEEARRLQKVGGPASIIGAALIRAGKDEEALPFLEKGEHAWEWAFAALAHAHLGHAEAAKKYLERVKAWKSEADRNAYASGANRWVDAFQPIEFRVLIREIEAVLKEEGPK
jgi:WD40 repeat protein/serine/threonine protein kinase/tetratricopeptide (TPR) repeat protein